MWAPKEYIPGLASVIIPTYNRAGYIEDALSSVFNQIYRPIEMIVIDDGSTDATHEVVKSWIESHSSDAYFTCRYYLKNNEGSQVARNTGIRLSHGEFLQFLDSDDILKEHKIENAVRLYRLDHSVDLIYSRWLVDNGKKIIEMDGPNLRSGSRLTEAILNNMCIFSPIYRRDVILMVGPFNESLKKAQDIEYCTRVVKQTNNSVRDDEFGGVYRLGKSNNSIIGSVSRSKLLSEWQVSQYQKNLLKKEPHTERKDQALSLISRRNFSTAQRTLAGDCPLLGLKIMIYELGVWRPVISKKVLKSLILLVHLAIADLRKRIAFLLSKCF
ncbi:glycosyltransferase [Thiorhodococcus mannitoliphagus]|uniref:Glycosyltransferase n=1 Tax=Thiorhodococcus mannitoliphagus TaxID=329406 RepID=A0A6P1DYR4_9GAMM|nr:glycosyltransferase [Thiorhodococcus mannitoliphagus]NEX22620.1 glycosyltransferase [Thiorhodococcus mannitoliphagus]